MAQIILVEGQSTLEAVYSLNLKTYLGVDVIPKLNAQEVIELLKSHTNIDLIVTRGQNSTEKTAVMIYKYLQAINVPIPMVILGEESLLHKFCSVLPEEPEIKDLVKACAGILGITPKSMVQQQVDDFYPIPIYYFMALSHFTSHTYLKVKTSSGPEFYKKFTQGTTVDMKSLQEIIQKGIQTLYIPKEFRLKLVNEVTVGLMTQLRSTQLSVDDKIQLGGQGMEIIRDQIKNIGFSQEIVELTHACLDSIRDLVGINPGLKLLLERLLSNKASYMFKHCQLVTYICFHAIDQLKWGGKEQQKLMAFVAFFHDISLGKEEMLPIRSEQELRSKMAHDWEREMVRRHAMEAAKLVQKFPRAPMSAETIIKQHHGSLNGIGFPRLFSNNISPLAIVFLLAEEFAHFILAHESHGSSIPISDKNNFRIHLRAKYSRSTYHKVLDALENLSF